MIQSSHSDDTFKCKMWRMPWPAKQQAASLTLCSMDFIIKPSFKTIRCFHSIFFPWRKTAYISMLVYGSLSPFGPVQAFLWNLGCTWCHYKLPKHCTFQFSTISPKNLADTETCENRATSDPLSLMMLELCVTSEPHNCNFCKGFFF